jgi:hypothetical protein
MTPEDKIIHSFLIRGAAELEEVLNQMKPDGKDFDELMEYERQLTILNKLKDQIKVLKNGK